MRYAILLTIGLFFIAGCGDAPRLGPDDNSDFGQISGHVISPYNEQGVSNVVLYTIPATTQAVTDTHGCFLLDSIPAGDYVVMIADTLLILQDYIWLKDSALVTVDDYDSIDCGILHIVRGVGWEFEDVSVGSMPYGLWLVTNGSWGVAYDPDDEAPSGTRILVSENGGAPDTLASLIVPTGTRVSYGFFSHFKIPADTMGVYGPRSRISFGVRYNLLSMYSLDIKMDRISLVRYLAREGEIEEEIIATNDDYSIAIGEWHTILISLRGDYISYQIDGDEFPPVFDNQLRTGGSTLVSVNKIRSCSFDDMLVLS